MRGKLVVMKSYLVFLTAVTLFALSACERDKPLSEKAKVSQERRQQRQLKQAALQQPVAKKSGTKSRKPTSSPDQIELFGDT